jgi:2-polyprenyl-6-hydroxyphenyl methylase/3-demethylubiquinone-9 3-methyltransferase
VQAYLRAEVEYIRESVKPGGRVLELGCGYGRVLGEIARSRASVVGIDLSLASLLLARRTLLRRPGVLLTQMNVAALSFRPASFDLVFCPQNGISVFQVDQRALIVSTLRLVAAGGKAQFFSYSEAFWPYRLAWFRIQAAAGLVGEIDESATGDGVIVCKDGFTATTVSADRFMQLTHGLDASISVSELDHSSIVCTLSPGPPN